MMQADWSLVLMISFFTVSLLLFAGFIPYLKLLLYKNKCDEVGHQRPVSVIICARNEEKNLEKFLVEVLEQNYPDFEVIVVNDRSFDSTKDILMEYEKRYGDKLKVVNIEEHVRDFPGKKLALTLGIKKAKNEFLIFTDADCVPASDSWISLIQRNFTDGKSFVLGYSPYFYQFSLLNLFVQFETFYTAINYLGFALLGMPYMGVGRNMAYRKSVFMENKGFASQLNISSGDDDLLVNHLSNSKNVAVEFCPGSFVMSQPKSSFKAWVKQKKRHLQAGKFYKKKHKGMLGIKWILNFLFYLLFAVFLLIFPFNYYVLGVFIFVFLLKWIMYILLLKKFGQMKLAPLIMIVDIVYNLVVYPVLGLATFFTKNTRTW